MFLIPALVALASLVLARGSLLPAGGRARIPRAPSCSLAPALLYSAYILSGPLARLPFLDEVYAHVLRHAVRLAAVGGSFWVWPSSRSGRAWPPRRPARLWSPRVANALVLLFAAWNLAQFGEWAVNRTYENYEASVAHRPRAAARNARPGQAGQRACRSKTGSGRSSSATGSATTRTGKSADDVRYILTYTNPRLGYEGSQITDVLDASPGWRIIMNFDVAETPSGHDSAALIEKRARH